MDVDSILVEGFTDNLGSAAHGVWLSRMRAEAVAAWLIARGVSERLISSRGWGEARPVANNDTEAGRKRNRRVEITVRIKRSGSNG